MSEYRFQGQTGLVTRSQNPNQIVSVWCGVQSGMQTDVRSGRWVAVCERHYKFRLFHTLKEAKLAIQKSDLFCDRCEN